MNRTYVLDPDLIDRLDATAGRLEVRQSDLVNFLLAKALDQVDIGVLQVPTRPKVYAIARDGQAG